MKEINTLQKFLDASGFARGINHPSVTNLKLKMKELQISEDLQIDVMSFFLYDHESTDETEDLTQFDQLFCINVKQNIQPKNKGNDI